MTSILNKFKSLAIAVMVVLFFIGVTLSACTSKDSGSENTDNVGAAADSEEHPEGEDEEHPEGEGEDEEHPEGEDEEHSEGEEKDKEEKDKEEK